MSVKTSQAGLFHTDESVAEVLAASFSGTATYKEVPAAQMARFDIVKAVQFSIATGKPVRVEGPAGAGKTSFIKDVAAALGYEIVAIHVPLFTPEGAGVPMPVDVTDDDGQTRKRLEFVLRGAFATPGNKIILLDEWNRAAANIANILMELLSEGSIAGVPIKGLVSVIALQNPQGAGYSVTNVDDAATASRFVSVQLGINGTPWREALGRKYETLDLGPLYREWEKLPAGAREDVNPRVLDHLIKAVTHGLPAIFALPAPNNERLVVRDEAGNDITVDTLTSLCAAIPGGAYRTPTPADVDRAYDLTLKYGWNLKDIRDPGTGKTKRAKARCAAAGIRSEYFSGPVMTPTDFGAVLPSIRDDGTTVLETAKWQRLTGDRFVLTIDEESRASKRVKNVLMELYQERTIDGQHTPVHAIIALDNPRQVVVGIDSAGNAIVERLNVGTTDAAQAGRFDLTLIGMSEAEKNYEWLLDTYGEVAVPFTVWHREDIDDLGRFYANFRVLETLIQCHVQGVDLQWALPIVGSERAPVPLADLHRRLIDKPRATLSAMADDTDTWVGYLKARSDHADEYVGVIRALESSELSVLTKYRDTVVALVGALDSASRLGLMVGATQERIAFLAGCMTDAAPR